MESSYGLKIMATHLYISQVYFGQFSQLTLGHRHSKTHLKFYFYFHILSLKIPLAANSLVLALKNQEDVFSLMYAEDAVLFSKTKQGMQIMLDKLSNYCNTWSLKVNTDKTNVMVFE